MEGPTVPLRWVTILGSLLVLIGFALGYFNWNREPYGCFDGKQLYGDWVVVASIGHLELRVKAWGCMSSDRYDPKQWRKTEDVPVQGH